MKKLIASIALILFLTGLALPAFAQSWSFVTVSDAWSGLENGLVNCFRDAVAYEDDVKFMVSTGDLSYPETVDSTLQQRCASYFPDQEYVAWFTTMGNHNNYLERQEFILNTMWPRIATESDYLPGMSNLRAGPPTGVTSCGRAGTTYSFDYENAHFVILNQYSELEGDCALGCIFQPVYDWLEADLEQNTQPIVFVFIHEPAFPPTGSHCGDSLDDQRCPGNVSTGERFSRPVRDMFWELLAEHNVVANFAGHLHVFSAKQIQDKSSFYGLPCTQSNPGEGCNSCAGRENTFCCYSDSLPEIAQDAVLEPSGGVIEFINALSIGKIGSGGWGLIRVDGSTISFAEYVRSNEGPGTLVRSFTYDASSLMGNTIYVDNGLGSNCTQYNPASAGACGSGSNMAYNTLTEAANNAVAGETVHVRAGTYNERLRPANSGTADDYITFRNYANETPIISPGSSNCFSIVGNDYIRIEGFACQDADAGWGGGLNMENANYNIVNNNDFLMSKENAITLDGSSNNVISNNSMIENGDPSWTGRGDGIIVTYNSHYNEIFNNTIITASEDGIDVMGNYNLIYNNIVYNAEAAAISFKVITGGSPPGGSFNEIYHNLVYSSSDTGTDIFNSAEGNIYTNNISITDGWNALALGSTAGTGNALDSSLLWNTNGGNVLGAGGTSYDAASAPDSFSVANGSGQNLIYQDPQIRDPGSGDFSLRSTSPARDRGAVIAGFHCPVSYADNQSQSGCMHWNGTAPDIGILEPEGPLTCVSTEILLVHISRWEQGLMNMSILINGIRAWKSGEGCT